MKKLVGTLLLVSAALWAQTNPLNMTTMQVVKDMGLGINLGNTMEAIIVCDPGDNGCENWVNSMETLETSWGSPTITKNIIKGYADAGFKTMRIPVSWSNKMTDNYTISPALLNRVEQIVNWVLENNMYAIVNIHYDGGWWEKFPTDSAECMKKYKRIWTQVSERFKDHSGYLILESLNEEGVWQDVWNRYNNTGDKTRAYNMLNTINQQFTSLVRTSGGNNGTRHLLIAGYATDINNTIDAAFKMPDDPQNHQAVSVHYYDPFGFTHINKTDDWTPLLETWGTQADKDVLNGYMDKLKTNFVDKDIPVIVGEYGFAAKPTKTRNTDQIRNYTVTVAKAIYSRDMCPVLWDTQLGDDDTQYYYNRKTNPPAFVDPQLVTELKAILPSSPSAITNSSPLATSYSLNPTYYSIKGEPLGNAKPQKAGIYIVKQGSSVKKIAVR